MTNLRHTITVRVDGVEETIGRINIFDMKKKLAAQMIVKKYAKAIVKEEKSTVSVSPPHRKKTRGKPGDLKKSIRAKYYFDGLGAMVIPMKPKGSHRHWIEYGTKDRYTKTGAFRGRVTAKPFAHPAEKKFQYQIKADLERVFVDDITIV